jgi:hypothetical protein
MLLLLVHLEGQASNCSCCATVQAVDTTVAVALTPAMLLHPVA